MAGSSFLGAHNNRPNKALLFIQMQCPSKRRFGLLNSACLRQVLRQSCDLLLKVLILILFLVTVQFFFGCLTDKVFWILLTLISLSINVEMDS